MLRFLIAVVGLIQLIAPDKVVEMYTRMAFEGPEAFRVRAWVVPAMRLEGLLMLWIAVNGLDGGSDEGDLEEQLGRSTSDAPSVFSA